MAGTNELLLIGQLTVENAELRLKINSLASRINMLAEQNADLTNQIKGFASGTVEATRRPESANG